MNDDQSQPQSARETTGRRPTEQSARSAPRCSDPAATETADFEPKFRSVPDQQPGRRDPRPTVKSAERRTRGLALKIGLAALVVLGTWVMWQPGGALDETKSPNWTHVQDVQRHAPSSLRDVAKWVDGSAAGQMVSSVGLSQQDLNAPLTASVQHHLRTGNTKAAQEALAKGQTIPPLPPKARDASGQPIQLVQPTITPGMAVEIGNGNTKFFQIFVYDSCQQDGDIVEVVINGSPFATVPLTHAGATLSVPITAGVSTEVSLRGIYDGGGGITVACKTSQGDFFMRSITVGQACNVGMILK